MDTFRKIMMAVAIIGLVFSLTVKNIDAYKEWEKYEPFEYGYIVKLTQSTLDDPRKITKELIDYVKINNINIFIKDSINNKGSHDIYTNNVADIVDNQLGGSPEIYWVSSRNQGMVTNIEDYRGIVFQSQIYIKNHDDYNRLVEWASVKNINVLRIEAPDSGFIESVFSHDVNLILITSLLFLIAILYCLIIRRFNGVMAIMLHSNSQYKSLIYLWVDSVYKIILTYLIVSVVAIVVLVMLYGINTISMMMQHVIYPTVLIGSAIIIVSSFIIALVASATAVKGSDTIVKIIFMRMVTVANSIIFVVVIVSGVRFLEAETQLNIIDQYISIWGNSEYVLSGQSLPLTSIPNEDNQSPDNPFNMRAQDFMRDVEQNHIVGNISRLPVFNNLNNSTYDGVILVNGQALKDLVKSKSYGKEYKIHSLKLTEFADSNIKIIQQYVDDLGLNNNYDVSTAKLYTVSGASFPFGSGIRFPQMSNFANPIIVEVDNFSEMLRTDGVLGYQVMNGSIYFTDSEKYISTIQRHFPQYHPDYEYVSDVLFDQRSAISFGLSNLYLYISYMVICIFANLYMYVLIGLDLDRESLLLRIYSGMSLKYLTLEFILPALISVMLSATAYLAIAELDSFIFSDIIIIIITSLFIYFCFFAIIFYRSVISVLGSDRGVYDLFG